MTTGDDVLDALLEAARHKFLNRSLDVRRESLEKLWDAWERLKTVETGKDKKVSAKALLDKRQPNPCFAPDSNGKRGSSPRSATPS